MHALWIGFGEVPSWDMDWLGSPSWAMDWLGSLSGHGLGRDHLSKGLDWEGQSLFEAGLLIIGMGQSDMDVLSLDPGYLSLCTHSAGRV